MDEKSGGQAIEYGVVPLEVMVSMSGLDFVRAIFAKRLPEPPIMQTVEPFDCTAEPGMVVIHSVPGLRHCNPIGSVHAAIPRFFWIRRWGSRCKVRCSRVRATPRWNSRSHLCAA